MFYCPDFSIYVVHASASLRTVHALSACELVITDMLQRTAILRLRFKLRELGLAIFGQSGLALYFIGVLR